MTAPVKTAVRLAQVHKPLAEPDIEDAGGPARPEPPIEDGALRWTFARSLCNAHKMARLSERESCDDGVPCQKLDACLNMALGTLAYMKERKSGRT